jgi:hypothetical protein
MQSVEPSLRDQEEKLSHLNSQFPRLPPIRGLHNSSLGFGKSVKTGSIRTASTTEEHVGVLNQDAFVFKPIAGGMNRTAKVNAYIQFLVDLAPSR